MLVAVTKPARAKGGTGQKDGGGDRKAAGRRRSVTGSFDVADRASVRGKVGSRHGPGQRWRWPRWNAVIARTGSAKGRRTRSPSAASETIANRPGAMSNERLDTMAFGRAQAAFDHTYSLFQAQIEALRKDCGLTADQREAALVALRQRQQLEAERARQRIIEEEGQNLRERRRAAKALQGPRPP